MSHTVTNLLSLEALQRLFPYFSLRGCSSNPSGALTKSHAKKSCGRRLKWKRKGPKAPPILNLPVEVVELIVNRLPLAARYHLSQTCRAMRQLAWCDFEAEYHRHLSRTSQKEFWLALAQHIDDRWACASCCTLHPIEDFDTPKAKQPFPTLRCLRHGGLAMLPEFKKLHYRHVQIALKLARTGKNPEFLDLLMSRYMFIIPFYEPDMSITYAGTPRIRQGHYMLHEKWVLCNEEAEMTRKSVGEFIVRLCPHAMLRPVNSLPLRFWQQNIQDPSFEVEVQFHVAMKNPGYEATWTCACCDTDCSIEVDNDRKKVRIQAWHDLGTAGSPLDPTWSRQVMNTLSFFTEPYHHESYARDLYNSPEPLKPPKGCSRILRKRVGH